MIALSQTVGLADLRQNASELVRRVEDGEDLVVTVQGRPAARLTPISQRGRLSGRAVNALLRGLPDWGVRESADLFDDDFQDPFER